MNLVINEKGLLSYDLKKEDRQSIGSSGLPDPKIGNP